MTWEWAFLDGLQSIRTPFLDSFMVFITTLGNGGGLWLAIAVVLLFFRPTRGTGACMLVSVALGALVGNLCLKPLFARPRPCWLRPQANLLIPNPTDYSFPSGHTLSSFAVATSLTLGEKRYGYIALPLAALMGFTRLYLYVHFPTDVLAGMALGVAVAILTHYFIRPYLEKGLNRIPPRGKGK